MPVVHCAIGEGVRAGDAIQIHVTGRLDDVLYLFVEAAWGQPVEAGPGFHASAPCGFGWNAHVMALRDDDRFEVGPVSVRVEDLRARASLAQPLRDVRLHLQAPDAMALVHIPRVRSMRPRLKAG